MSTTFEQLDWDAYRRGLAAQGKHPSEATLARVRELAQDSFSNNGLNGFPSDFYGIITYMITSPIQALQHLFAQFTGKRETSLNEASAATDYKMLNQTMHRLNLAMMQEGGEVAQLASITTGGIIQGSGQPLINMAESLKNQALNTMPAITPDIIQRGPSLNLAEQTGPRYPVIPVSEHASPNAPLAPTPQLTGRAPQG